MPFANVLAARLWAETLVRWYNFEHRRSFIAFVTPQQRHTGLDQHLLHQRDRVYRQARANNPQRWSKNTRNWSYIDRVNLNPNS